ncbi:MAG: cell wall-associated hydrolase, invasion-associated protein [Pedosphaera sp.]|nr:cell wall-associated hydrolase, invasion-associated protein [Pedosphaera sp.]
MADGSISSKYNRALKKRWYALWPIAAALILYPINNIFVRVGILAALAGLWGGLLYFYWDRKVVRFGCIGLAGLVVVLMMLPGRNADAVKLRQRYVTSLSSYEGTRYIWGGENKLGIDCSGLVRSGLIVANYKEGFSSINPRLVRRSLSMWWHDCSAKALGEEYRGQTRRLFRAESINEIQESKMLPGDIVVTASGVHTLAYIGDQTWIEADPGEKRVIRVRVPSDSPWFKEPVSVLRWTQFDSPNSK